MGTTPSRYQNFVQIYQSTPTCYKENLNPYYMELILDRRKMLGLDLTLSEIKNKVQTCFVDLKVYCSPDLNKDLVMLCYLPNDMNEENIKSKAGQQILNG